MAHPTAAQIIANRNAHFEALFAKANAALDVAIASGDRIAVICAVGSLHTISRNALDITRRVDDDFCNNFDVFDDANLRHAQEIENERYMKNDD